MPNAKVVDLTAYRESKKGAPNPFKFWSDKRIETRFNLLSLVNKHGIGVLGGPEDEKMIRTSFPDGFDPELHVEDNEAAVYAEGVRRGVFDK